jgi:cytidylate kinase
MKKLIFIHGPNGVGKSTLCKALLASLPNSAWVESEWCRMTNPFAFTEEYIQITERNMTFLLRSYLECSTLDFVIFNYGFHGPRKQIFDNVISNLSDIDYQFVPITITCSYEENKLRMIKDGRDEERIKRALVVRGIYEGLGYPVVDTTHLTVEETVDKVIDIVESSIVAI